VRASQDEFGPVQGVRWSGSVAVTDGAGVYSRGFVVSIAEEFLGEKTEDKMAPQNISSTVDGKRNKEEDRRIQLRNISSALSLTRADTCVDQSLLNMSGLIGR
jgi:hypothetical protein